MDLMKKRDRAIFIQNLPTTSLHGGEVLNAH
jgi:hypothetical protein